MKYDVYGRPYADTENLVSLLYQNPDLDLSNFFVQDPDIFNKSVKDFHAEFSELKPYVEIDQNSCSIEQFDNENQKNWFMPKKYLEMDIEKNLIELCKNDTEKSRVLEELLLYKERNLYNLLKFLYYLVDMMRSNNIVWGVGRGSSVASYILFLIGVHHIDSIKYELDINEFLK